MFTVAQRDQLRERLLKIAREDRRVVAAAEIGSLTHGGGDRWSDLDLTFGVLDDVDLIDVVDEWTAQLADEYSAVHIFDLPSSSTIYRVFLFPGTLQVDLSFTPASEFGPLDPFQLIFGNMSRDHHQFLRQSSTCSVSGLTMQSALAYASSELACGRRNTG